jgi:hypothetical protein
VFVSFPCRGYIAAGRLITDCSKYPVQQHSDCAIRVQSRLVTPELRDLANEHDNSTDKVVEVWCSDARGGHLLGHVCVWFLPAKDGYREKSNKSVQKVRGGGSTRLAEKKTRTWARKCAGVKESGEAAGYNRGRGRARLRMSRGHVA